MNKLKLTIAGLFVACLGIGVVSAQTGTATTPAPAKTATTTASGSTTAKPAQHLKKDGTPDKRYKENKTAPAAKKSTGTKKAATTATAPAATPAK